MVLTGLIELIYYLKSAPLCDGNHEWVIDEEFPEETYCSKCFVIKDDNNA